MEDIDRLGSSDPRREVNLTGKPFVRLDREPGGLVAESSLIARSGSTPGSGPPPTSCAPSAMTYALMTRSAS